MLKYTNKCVDGFLHADGTRIKNGKNEEVILRGPGVGNWMDPEGFMIGADLSAMGGIEDGNLRLPKRMDRGRSMDLLLRELCGAKYAESYWMKWMTNYLQEADIRAMAEFGYNSVRLPLASRLLLEEGPGIHFIEDSFKHLDNVLDWCEKYHIYAILDLHAAPGGQSGLLCDDGLDNQPHMFTEPESRERALLIWEKLAERYKDREIVGGYDLLNEPISPPYTHWLMKDLADFYDEAIQRIRKIDKNHMFTIEGAMMASDLTIFDHDFDPECHNWCIHVHSYGFTPHMRDFHPVLEVSRNLNVPIWLGEGRSGNEEMAVFYDTISYYGVGFNQWSWKACEGPDSDGIGMNTYQPPKNWEKVKTYISSGGPRPTYEESQVIFDEMLQNIRWENCTPDIDRHKYTLRQQGITLPASGYDHGIPGDGTFSSGWYHGNAWSYRTEDGTHLSLKPGLVPPGRMRGPRGGIRRSPLTELLLHLNTDEYVTYTIRDIKSTCQVTLNAEAKTDVTLRVYANDMDAVTLNWPVSQMSSRMITELPEGTEGKVKIEVLNGELVIDSIAFI